MGGKHGDYSDWKEDCILLYGREVEFDGKEASLMGVDGELPSYAIDQC